MGDSLAFQILQNYPYGTGMTSQFLSIFFLFFYKYKLQTDWQGFPGTFQVSDERDVPEDSVTTRNKIDNERRATTYGYKDMKAKRLVSMNTEEQ